MKFLIIFALFAAVAYALPIESYGQDQEVADPLLFVADLEANNSDYESVDDVRQKRQFVGLPNPASYPGQGGQYPHQGGGYPQQGGGYPQQGGGYPQQGGGYPQQQGQYQGGGFGTGNQHGHHGNHGHHGHHGK
ncbi:hypothetical protein ACKWTF_000337 [Chironomus riparius]